MDPLLTDLKASTTKEFALRLSLMKHKELEEKYGSKLAPEDQQYIDQQLHRFTKFPLSPFDAQKAAN